MKLGEALTRRKDLATRISQVFNDLKGALVHEKEVKPDQDAAKLYIEFNDLLTQHGELIATINRTNSNTPFNDKLSIADAIAFRDELKSRQTYLDGLIIAARPRRERNYSDPGAVVEYVSQMPAASLRDERDRVAKEYRELDVALQGLNWTVDLV